VTDPAGLAGLTSPGVVTVYGLDTCDDTTRARRHFDAAGLDYRYVRLDQDAAAKATVNATGYFATPVVVTPAGRVLVEPDDTELAAIIAEVSGAG
jgi:glutaredoxin